MTRTATFVLALLLLGLIGMVPADARDEKKPEVKDVMKANKPGGLYFGMVRELKAKDTMWPDVAEDAKDYARLAALLPKTTPPQGDADSWARLSKAFADNAAALEKAAARKDKPAAQAAINRLEASCDACHKIHRKE